MDKNALLSPIELTEWDWFVMQLRIHSLESRFNAYTVYYKLHDLQDLSCHIYSPHTQELLDQASTSSEQLEYYRVWVDDIKQYMSTVLENLPAMKQDFDIEQDFTYLILHQDEYQQRILCEFRHRHINWP